MREKNESAPESTHFNLEDGLFFRNVGTRLLTHTMLRTNPEDNDLNTAQCEKFETVSKVLPALISCYGTSVSSKQYSNDRIVDTF